MEMESISMLMELIICMDYDLGCLINYYLAVNGKMEKCMVKENMLILAKFHGKGNILTECSILVKAMSLLDR